MEEKDTGESDSPESNREISYSSSDQLGRITKKRSHKRKRFIVARDLTINPDLELGEELVIPKERVRKTAIVSDSDSDDDSSGNYQKVRITPKKRIRKKRKITPTKENTSSDAENSKSDDGGDFFIIDRKRIRRRENNVKRFNAINSATDSESSTRTLPKSGDFREKDEPCFLEFSEACDSTSPSGYNKNNEEQYAMHTDEGQVSDSEDSLQGNEKEIYTSENESDNLSSELSGHDSTKTSDTDSHEVSSSDGEVREGDQPVCDGTNIKRKTFEATFLALSNKHKFSKSTRTDILKFLDMVIPNPNLPTSNYTFEKNLMEEMNINYSKRELCLCCNTTINDGKCRHERCEKFNRKLNDHEIEICYFIPLKDQLQRILAENWDKIIEYKQDHAHGHGIKRDICCGEVYQNTPGKDDPEKQISLIYHIDGAPAVKSKSMNLWPIQCFVVELPPNIRYCFSNVLVCGLSCTPTKPDLKVFQERFVTELEQLQGFQVKICRDFANISIERVILHGHLADLVAKAPSLCFCQFNGKSGCSICLHPGQRIQHGKGSIRIYPYTLQEPPRRTHEQTLLHAQTAERIGKPVFGVKAFSPLLRVLEVPSKVLLDYMHLVLAGEFLRRLNIWLDHQSDKGFLSQSKDEVDAALLNVKFPHDFHRKLRSINELKRWKNRELQNFFLHASLPILKTFFPDDYFCHFALLVTAIWLLTDDIITDSDIEIAKLLIRSYQRLIPSLYGEREQTYTCHALGHLPSQVREHGPLILHSSFVFEAMISHLKRQFHGTRGIVAQIVRNLLFSQNSGSFIKEETQEPQEVKTFIEENIMGKKDKHLHTLGATCSFIPPLKSNPKLPDGVVHCLDLEGQQVHLAERMLKDGQIFHSLAYKRRGKSCSYIVEFRQLGNTNYGTVNYYLLARNTGFAVISVLQKRGNICSFGLEKQDDSMISLFIERGILGKHFQAVQETPETACIDCSDIVRRCVFVPYAGDGVCGFVCPVLRHYQHD